MRCVKNNQQRDVEYVQEIIALRTLLDGVVQVNEPVAQVS